MSASSQPAPAAPVAIPRQQLSIERLPTRRRSNEPRESMNCKSCRKRKIKCNRMRPSCEACQVFQCSCVYDAIPKKRGPKTDVLEALLKRVDGLEAKLKEKNADEDSSKTDELAIDEFDEEEMAEITEPAPKRVATDTSRSSDEDASSTANDVQTGSRDDPASLVDTNAFLHTYFTRFHGKPYYILDESSVRQRMQINQLPDSLVHAIWAVASRHTQHPLGAQAAVKLSEDYAFQARQSLDTDDPSIETLQTLLLLVLAFTASGHGKKAFMLMSSAAGMAIALELHREMDAQALVTPVDRELRRRLFWTCYLLDRYLACGSKRSSLINDSCIALRLPSWCPSPSSLAVEGEFFQQGSNLQYYQGSGKKSQGSTGMLIDITRLLSMTNRYVAAGGVKGDSHFPWHSLSTLSKIRQELDFWASGAGSSFSGLHALFGQAEATIVFLSKLIYHVIHCLVYRPFLPIDLAELVGNGQHQSWQIEATNMCFLHANAIGELIDAARQSANVEWPAIVGYCICTAATVHIHGAHYTNPSAYGGDVNVFAASSDFISREMQCVKDLQFSWANVKHQSDTLQGIYKAHGELVQAMVSNSMRYTTGFHLEDFFDRYLNIGGHGGKSYRFDPSHLSLSDIVDFTAARYEDFPSGTGAAGAPSNELHGHKRKNTASSLQTKHPDIRSTQGHEQAAMSSSHQPTPLRKSESSYPLSLSHQIHEQPQNQQQTKESSMQPQRAYAAGPPDAHLGIGASSDASGDTTAQSYGATMPSSSSASNRDFVSMGGPGSGISSNVEFTPYFGYTPSSNVDSCANDAATHYDPMFGSLPSHTFNNSSGWQTYDGAQHRLMLSHSGMAASPGNKSASGSTGTGHSDEKDPFLCLLEQLAEDHGQRFHGVGTDLDLFFSMNNGSTGE